MPFIITKECKCCREFLHHCEKCWNEHHNGEKHKDYIPPKYYGESMMPDTSKELKELGVIFEANVTILKDKNKKYKEGEYH